MAKSLVKINAQEFVRKLTKAQKKLNRDVLVAFSHILDNVRMKAADKYIIPRKGPAPTKGKGTGYLAKIQPPDKTYLTERTGLLKRVLKSSGSWSKSFTTMRLRASKHLLFWVTPQTEGNKFYYLARMSVVEKGVPGVKYRIRHETHGSRNGTIRKFFEPALNDERRNIPTALNKVLQIMRTV